MVDRVSASIAIGGILPAIHVPTFIGLIIDEGLSLDWEGEPFLAEQLSSGSPLPLMAHEVALGRFEPLEDFCVAHSLSYVRWCAGCSSWGAQRAVFTGVGEIRLFPVDADDGVLIDRATVMKFGNIEAIIAYLDSADYGVPPLMIVGTPSEADGNAAKPSAICCLVSVGATVAPAELEDEDRSVPGLYAIVVDQADVDRHQGEDNAVIEAAKDIFHASIPIGNLDHFSIDVAIVSGATPMAGGAKWLTSASSPLPR
ncbi:hypothetical protein [Novosphingobium terrae]|uniref:hypothetical protein n=1 Tax=Novosphingobium terrae TaxID=2726189 RepID=UPI00197F5A68|nr:hypothetical protein [Novosphingobium terrae]